MRRNETNVTGPVNTSSEPTMVPHPKRIPRLVPKLTTLQELAKIALDEGRVVKARRKVWDGQCILWLKPYSRRVPAMHLTELAANDWYEVKP